MLTASRVIGAAWILQLVVAGGPDAAAVLCGAAMVTDCLDGQLVRKFGTPSATGAYFDVWADFLTVVAAFGGLAVAGIVSVWPLVVICISFALFLATAAARSTIYDPIGRYLGGILMVAALVLLMAQDFLVQEMVLITSVIACGITMLGRVGVIVARTRS